MYLFDSGDIGDDGVASLVDKLGKDDFKALEVLHLAFNNKITSVGNAKMVAAIDAGGLPKLTQFRSKFGLEVETNRAVQDALRRRSA